MRRKKLLLVIASVLTLAAIGGGVYYFVLRDDKPSTKQTVRPENTVDYGPAKPEDSAGVTSDKEKSAQEATKPGTGDTPKPSSINATITQAQQSDAIVMIRTLVEGATSGTCNLTLSRSGQSFTRTAPVTVQGSYALCQGFNVPVSDFPAAGEWKASLSVTAADGQTSPVTEKGVQVTK